MRRYRLFTAILVVFAVTDTGVASLQDGSATKIAAKHATESHARICDWSAVIWREPTDLAFQKGEGKNR